MDEPDDLLISSSLRWELGSLGNRARQTIDNLTPDIEAWETETAKSSKYYLLNRRQRAIFKFNGINIIKMSEVTRDIREAKEELEFLAEDENLNLLKTIWEKIKKIFHE